jgi:hypothetical protein
MIRNVLLGLVILAVSTGIASVAVMYRVSENSIAASLERTVGAEDLECTRGAGDEYNCGPYRLLMRGRCWSARGEGRTASGCISLRDQHPIYEYFLGSAATL